MPFLSCHFPSNAKYGVLILYVSALQSFLLWCTLKDVLMNSCTVFTSTHAPYLLTRPSPNCAHVCKYPGLNKQVPLLSNSAT